MKNLLLSFSLLLAGTAAAGDIDWTNTAGGGTLPIAPPGNDPGFTVGPIVPISFIPPDSEFYAHCGVGYSCNFLKSGAENKYRDEARQKAKAEKDAYQQKLDQETAKIDKDLDALRIGSELSQSPEGQKAQNDLKKAQALRESAKAKRAATLQFVKEAEGKVAEEFAVKFGLVDTKNESELMAIKAKLDLSSGKNYLQQRINLANKKADSVEATINSQGGEYKEQRLTFAKIGRTSLGVAQVRLNENDIRTAQIAYKIGTMALDIGLGFVPGVSTFKDGYEALLGKSLVTGESLTKFERSVAAVGLITLGLGSTIGRSLKAAEKGAEVFKDVAKAIESGEEIVKVADDASDAIKSAMNIRSKLSNIGEVIPGTIIPKHFTIETEGAKFFVHPNATKHMGEYIGSLPVTHNFPIRNDLMLASFEGGVKDAVSSGAWKASVDSGQPIISGGWELIFSQRAGDLLPVIKHALMK